MRGLIGIGLGAACLAGVVALNAFKTPTVEMVVYKSPTCGCCEEWVKRLSARGHSSQVNHREDLDVVKDQMSVPIELRSCHTAVVNGYVFEGHVPIDLVEQVLSERPKIRGLAVPGMPAGSEGMELPGGRKAPYEVFAFDLSGGRYVYARR